MPANERDREDGMYKVPRDDRPHWVDWEAGVDLVDADAPAEVRWWLPATLDNYGGRDAQVVIDSKGEMAVYHGPARVGTASAPYRPHVPNEETFWPLTTVDIQTGGLTNAKLMDPADASHLLRDTGWLVALVNQEFGLAMGIPPDGEDEMSWRLTEAFTLLGFYPPLAVGFAGTLDEFKMGIDVIGERAARRVKRALISRLDHDRRELRKLADLIETNWRT